MLATENTSSPAPEAAAADPDVLHEVSWWQWLLGDVLRVTVPRALCGESLLGDPDVPEPGPDAPRCPRCTAIRDERGQA